jgi:hypothetical protein
MAFRSEIGCWRWATTAPYSGVGRHDDRVWGLRFIEALLAIIGASTIAIYAATFVEP